MNQQLMNGQVGMLDTESSMTSTIKMHGVEEQQGGAHKSTQRNVEKYSFMDDLL